jgi:hypothetical protein
MSGALRDRERFSPCQCRAGRALKGWSAEDLARRVRLEPEAIELYEAGEGGLSEGELALVGYAFSAGDVIAIRACHAGEGVRFSRPQTPSPFERDFPPARDDFDGPSPAARADEVAAHARHVGDTLKILPNMREPHGR